MLLSNLDLLATAPGGVARLRELILTLAVQGKLVPQDPEDEPARELLKKIRAEKDRLIAEGKIRRDKPLAEIAEDEQPFELPRGWCWTRVADICTLVTDGEHATPQRCDDQSAIPLVTAKNVRHEVMDYRVTDFVPLDIAQKCWQRCKPAVGDVLMVSVGATLGRLCVLREAVEMVLVRSVTVLRPAQSGVMPDFLACHLMSPATQREIWGEVKQSAQPCLYLAKSAALKIALPPLAEQSRIVTRVEELMRLCDALEAKGQLEAAQHAQLVSALLATLTDSATPEALTENWQSLAIHFDTLLDRPEAVDALEQTVLQLAVRGLLVPQDPTDEPASVLLKRIRTEKDRLIAAGQIKRDKPLEPIADDEKPFEVPQGWEWARVGSLGVTQTGGTPASSKPEYFAGNFPFIGPGQITPSGKILPAEKFISELGSLESAIAARGDILMVCIGGSIGKSAPASYATAFNQQINSIHPLLASSEYVLNALSSIDFVDAVVNAATGSATPIISKGKWDVLLLPLPPLAEQARIVARVEALRRLCSDLRQRLSASQTAQARLAEALVAEVGNIDDHTLCRPEAPC